MTVQPSMRLNAGLVTDVRFAVTPWTKVATDRSFIATGFRQMGGSGVRRSPDRPYDLADADGPLART